MNSQKVDNQLNLALNTPNDVRNKTNNLDVGFDAQNNTWELIVRYNTSLQRPAQELGFLYDELINGYAIITIDQDKIDRLVQYSEIEFIEKPRNLVLEIANAKDASCIPIVNQEPLSLNGQGTIVAIIDSGIDYTHSDFRNEDGTTRILAIWDQSVPAQPENGYFPPEGYVEGTLYTREQINEALRQTTRQQQIQIVPSLDLSGHGTQVTGIAAGNGRASNGRYRGVAYEADILVVKLGISINNSFPKTSQLMTAIDFCTKYALKQEKPVAINLSFGNNYGSHDGNSILESYINEVSGIWKNCIIVGTGNEGASRTHTSGILSEDTNTIIELAVAEGTTNLNMQIWKNYYDEFDLSIIHPSGNRIGPIPQVLGNQNYVMSQTNVLLYFGEPQPSNKAQEIYIEFIPQQTFLVSGIWRFELTPRRILAGNYDLWLPSGGLLSAGTGFSRPVPETTLTIPSTAARVISVGAYNSNNDSAAAFSGRGFTRGDSLIKPDLVAPGVSITTTSVGGGYSVVSGTSFATPFVTGSCALLMEWGIVKENDLYLYGEKVKAYLINGVRILPGFTKLPNPQVGWGALCLRDSIPV